MGAVTSKRDLLLDVPRTLVEMAGMQPGALTLVSEAGAEWQSWLRKRNLFNCESSFMRFKMSWSAVVAALQLEAGQNICLAALSPSRLLVSRQGEPHFSAAASQGPPDPWPLTVLLSQSVINQNRCFLSAAAGRSICREGVKSVPAVILHHSTTSTAGEAVEKLSTLVVRSSQSICVSQQCEMPFSRVAFWQTRQLPGDICYCPKTAAAHACSETNVVPA
jgi:hypothetical protein